MRAGPATSPGVGGGTGGPQPDRNPLTTNPWFIMAGGLVITLWVAVYLHQHETREMERHARQMAEWVQFEIRRGLLKKDALLNGLHHFFQASQEVTAEEFETYLRGMERSAPVGGWRTVFWMPRTDGGETPVWSPGFQFPATAYVPPPMEQPLLHELLESTWQRGTPDLVLTDLFPHRIQDSSTSLLWLVPVTGSNINQPAPKTGLLGMVIDMPSFLESALAPATSRNNHVIFSLENPDGGPVIAQFHWPSLTATPPPARSTTTTTTTLYESHAFWKITVLVPKSELLDGLRLSWWFTLGGLLFSTTLFFLVKTLNITHARDRELAQWAQRDLVDTQLRLDHTRKMAQALTINQQRLELAIQAAHIGVWEWDIPNKRFIFSPSWLKMCGEPGTLTEEEESLTLLRIHPDDQDMVNRKLERLLSGEDEIMRVELRLRRADGSFFMVESVARVVSHDTARNPLWVVGVTHDIGDRHRLEAERLRASKLESTGLLAGGLAHDLNNVLTIVLGNLGLAMEDPDNSRERHALLDEARRACSRAAAMTRELLTFAKGGEPVRDIVATADLLRETAKLCSHGVSCIIELDVPDRLPPVCGDASQLSQVFQNIIINAVQAMPHGGRLVIRATAVTSPAAFPNGMDNARPSPGLVHISFQDEGSGIPAGMLDKIFDPYFSTKPGGTGLGMAISYSVIHRHGGTIDVQSSPGHGTTVHIRLPTAPDTPAMPAPGSATGPAPTGLRVLVMDDQKPILQVLAKVLGKMGIDTTLSENAAQAITELRRAHKANNPFDVALLDLTLPEGRGGKDVVADLRGEMPDIYFVAMSGYSADPVMSDHTRYGFNAALPKPFTREQLSDFFRTIPRKKSPAPAGAGQTPSF